MEKMCAMGDVGVFSLVLCDYLPIESWFTQTPLSQVIALRKPMYLASAKEDAALTASSLE